MKFILDAKNNTHGLYYCMTKVSDTEYYAYTFSVDQLMDAANTENEIVAYRTTLVKTDKWRATTSVCGKAKVKELSRSSFGFDVSADPNCESYSMDPKTWHS